MLIGAHVSTAGGLDRAVARGDERGCDAIQIFNQSPRAWRPTAYGAPDLERCREAMAESRVQAIVIHAIYLINCASPDPAIREKSLAALTHALQVGDGIGAAGVVLHAGSRKKDPYEEALPRVGELVREALAESEGCPVLLENTAGTQGPLGRDLGELADLVDACGGGDRVGICIDSCHMFASGMEISTAEALTGHVDVIESEIGLERLRCLHVNDSKVPFGGNRDSHANVGEGEIGPEGISLFLSEPRFEGLPAVLETPGPEKKGPDAAEVARGRELRELGLRQRVA